MNTTPMVEIDVVSDVMCPWCYIGQKNLERGIAMATEVPVEIRWRPFQLDPTLPPEGRDRKEYLDRKFGGGDKAKAIYERVTEAGSAAGIAFRFEDIKVAPNTLDAHRLIRWAGGISSAVQHALARRLFQLYFEEGANVGDREVLVAAAASCGLDAGLVRELLSTDRDIDNVRQEIAQAQQMGVTGVPCFIIGGKYAVMGAQPAETIAMAIRQFAAETSGATDDGPDGSAD